MTDLAEYLQMIPRHHLHCSMSAYRVFSFSGEILREVMCLYAVAFCNGNMSMCVYKVFCRMLR